MATVTHTLYSNYDPKDRERLEQETGQLADDILEDPSETWRKEAAQAYPKRTAAAPRFVAARVPYDAWDSNATSSSSKVQLEDAPVVDKTDSLYKSLPRSKVESKPYGGIPRSMTVPPPMTAPAPVKPTERANKNNWFIMKAIQSESGSVSTPATPTPTLADILSREPPPLPSEAKIKPPVWLSIGPSNKGFSMLQRIGWNEGETLGPYAIRQKHVEPTLPDFLDEADPRYDKPSDRKKETSSVASSSKQMVEVKLEDYGDDITELKEVDIVDLTFTSDSELEDEDKEEASSHFPDPEIPLKKTEDSNPAMPQGISGHGGRALLTPIATVLKADRMGIGLKPKTVAGPAGAYRIPQKRVTYNSAALAAHIRAAEELKRQKKEGGRGRRALERQRKKEASERKAMLAYLNS